MATCSKLNGQMNMRLVTKIYGHQAQALIDQIIGQEKGFDFKVATVEGRSVVEVWAETADSDSKGVTEE